MTAASAPGKVILFGEHAVVSGSPALGSAVDMRVLSTIEDLPGRLEVDVSDLKLSVSGFSVDLISGQVNSQFGSQALQATRYVSAVLHEFDARNLRVSIRSEIPPAAGLGSSAAITVSTLTALNGHLDLKLSRDDLAREAYLIEKAVQKGLGSPMDTALATFGGYQMVSEGEIQGRNLPELDLVVGYTQREHDTMSEVGKVQSLRSTYPEVVNPIFEAIGAISKRALKVLKDERLEELGDLMNLNQGLLESLGVCTRELNELVYAARGAGGALGAKLTGAGGGGCIIALPPPEGTIAVTTAIRQARGVAFPVRTGCEGARLDPCSRF